MALPTPATSAISSSDTRTTHASIFDSGMEEVGVQSSRQGGRCGVFVISGHVHVAWHHGKTFLLGYQWSDGGGGPPAVSRLRQVDGRIIAMALMQDRSRTTLCHPMFVCHLFGIALGHCEATC